MSRAVAGVGLDGTGRLRWWCSVCGKARTQGSTPQATNDLLRAHLDSPLHRLAASRARRRLAARGGGL